MTALASLCWRQAGQGRGSADEERLAHRLVHFHSSQVLWSASGLSYALTIVAFRGDGCSWEKLASFTAAWRSGEGHTGTGEVGEVGNNLAFLAD